MGRLSVAKKTDVTKDPTLHVTTPHNSIPGLIT